MKTNLFVLFVVLGVGTLLAQTNSYHDQRSGSQPYTPAVPAATVQNYGGWGGGGYGGTTAAGSAMQGMASCVQAAGNYNLSTSAAAINMTVAERNQIQNSLEFTNTYFEKQRANRAAQAAQRRCRRKKWRGGRKPASRNRWPRGNWTR